MRLDNRTCNDNADEAVPGLEPAAAVTYGYVVKSRPFRNSRPSFLETMDHGQSQTSSIQSPLHLGERHLRRSGGVCFYRLLNIQCNMQRVSCL